MALFDFLRFLRQKNYVEEELEKDENIIRELAMVRATRDLSIDVLKGCRGTVLDVYPRKGCREIGYEVEFFDDEYNYIDVLTLESEDIEEIK